MRIDRIANLSIQHMSPADAYLMAKRSKYVPMWTEPHEFGWFVWCDVEPEVFEDQWLSLTLRKALRYARGQGCTWIRFDCDEDPTPDLPQEHWS
jgi:hypothetical protein